MASLIFSGHLCSYSLSNLRNPRSLLTFQPAHKHAGFRLFDISPPATFKTSHTIRVDSRYVSHLVNTTFRPYSSREWRKAQREMLKERKQTEANKVVPSYEETSLKRDTPSYNLWKEENQAPSYDQNASTEELMNPSVMQHLRKVYTTITAMIGAAAIGGASYLVLPASILATAPFVGLLGSIGCILGVYFSNPKNILFRQNLLMGFGFLSGLSITGLLSIVSLPTILMALAGTTAIFAGFSLAAIRAKSTTFLSLGGVLGGSILFLLGISLISWLGPMLALPLSPAFYAALHNVNLYLGLGIFSLFVSYDTQRMITNAYEGNTDHVSDALSMFINVYSIFVRLLSIFRDE